MKILTVAATLLAVSMMMSAPARTDIPELPMKEPSQATPGADPMEGHYGNTLIAWGNGWVAHYWYEKDHTYIAFRYKLVRDEMQFEGERGTWDISSGESNGAGAAVNNGGLCRHSAIRKNRCMVYGLYQKPGDSWVVWWHNEAQHFQIIAGQH